MRADRGQLPIDQSASFAVFVKNIAGLEIAMDDADRRSIWQPRCQQCAKLGAHVATVPPNVLRSLFKHVLTDNGLKAFLDDWKKTGQSIL